MAKQEKAKLRKAIRSLHALRVIHNDLKWDNIIFNDHNVYIIDYGFAEISSENNISIKHESRFALDL